MIPLHNPIYTGQVNGRAVRFFRAPNGVVALPWHSVADLVSAAGLPLDAQRVFIDATRSGPFQDAVRTVNTDAGKCLIAPHFVAQGTIGAFKKTGFLPDNDEFDTAFCLAGCEAANVLHEGLSPAERMRAVIQMGRNHLGLEDEE
ncbi:hypothetical protein [Tanticharoenia sakaeratensis]|uniref:Uncharacterized protein n=1 Tax=Tanticharoenia sakaeratensis NBRC 103193 TaxID=1231623 RepID=A0A0D6MPV0_9PROT|nr:hypothetical protein [Tanticharoenia sakaeratensis]GAN55461.1 hypothetical protein Tasa_048_086 [Tanticharoenia sakaeratensis NBRC 103193]GBQ22008.1 hypothetical protein AA103193_1925 [Tanticharoenia sakaeratensis NBRC 103193]